MVVPDCFEVDMDVKGAAEEAKSTGPCHGGGGRVVFFEVVFCETGDGVFVPKRRRGSAPFLAAGDVDLEEEGEREACTGGWHARRVVGYNGGEFGHGADAG